MKNLTASKTGLALAAAAAISLGVPAYAWHDSERSGRGYDRGYDRGHDRQAPERRPPAYRDPVDRQGPPLPPGNYTEPVPTVVQGYWHYCRPANGYYPVAQRCPVPWELIVPRPPALGSSPAG